MMDFTNSNKIFDTHIHIGQYHSIYTSPEDILSFLDSVGVWKFAVSSTTTCEENYQKVIYEFKKFTSKAEGRAIPVLWVTPQMINSWNLFSLFDQGIEWKCLKIHPQLAPEEWIDCSANLMLIASVASLKHLPLLIHTGEMYGCFPKDYGDIISQREDVTFILAHGRPINETIDMMKKYPNVWVDTAFMPTDNIKKLCDENLSDRVLWGTDYPIPKHYYPDKDMKDYYLTLIQQLKETIKSEDFEKITCKNFKNLFG